MEALIEKLRAAAIEIDNDGKNDELSVVPLDLAITIIQRHDEPRAENATVVQETCTARNGTLNRQALQKASIIAYSEINYPDENPGGAQGAAERIIHTYLAALSNSGEIPVNGDTLKEAEDEDVVSKAFHDAAAAIPVVTRKAKRGKTEVRPEFSIQPYNPEDIPEAAQETIYLNINQDTGTTWFEWYGTKELADKFARQRILCIKLKTAKGWESCDESSGALTPQPQIADR